MEKENKKNSNFSQNGDQPDIFVFRKPNYDSRPTAIMPVDRDSMFYNMNHKNRGHAVIFNHEHFDMKNLRSRTGTSVDAMNLSRELERLGFQVSVYNDFKTKQILELVNSIAKTDHSDCDCFLLIVLSHGEMGIIYGRDSAYKAEQLWAPFTADKCLTLAGKPKLFFIQACQGDLLDSGTTLLSRTETDSGMVTYKIPNYADFLIAYSTVPGYYSWRNTTQGSWFIQALCIELRDNADKLDLLTLLTMVSRRVALDFESNCPNDTTMHRQKQIPCISTMLTRLIRFVPKGDDMDVF